MTLREVLESAGELPGVETTIGAFGEAVWSCAGRPFATLSRDGAWAEFGLEGAIAAAAARTPDVALSGRGPGWVRFAPRTLDDHGIDRATAWLISAHRRVDR